MDFLEHIMDNLDDLRSSYYDRMGGVESFSDYTGETREIGEITWDEVDQEIDEFLNLLPEQDK